MNFHNPTFVPRDLVGFNKSSQRISFLSLVKNCNHKGLGIYYLLSAFIFGISGTLISVLIRIELLIFNFINEKDHWILKTIFLEIVFAIGMKKTSASAQLPAYLLGSCQRSHSSSSTVGASCLFHNGK